MYLMLGTHPNLAYTIGKLAWFSANPSLEHLHALEHIFAYVNQTGHYCLTYLADGKIFPCGYVNADFASDPSDQTSISRYTFIVASGAFSWSSKKQQSVMMSTMEAEYTTTHSGSLNALWVWQFFKQIGLHFENPLTLYCDNQGAITTAKAKQTHQCLKHIDIKHHSICQNIEWSLIQLNYVPSKENLVDIFTKSLPYEAHNQSAQDLGLMYFVVDKDTDASISQYLSINSEGDGWIERECWKLTIESNTSTNQIPCL